MLKCVYVFLLMGVRVHSPDLRDAIKILESEGELICIKQNLSPKFEIPAALKLLDGGPAVLFENVQGYSFRIVGGICNSRRKLSLALKVPENKLHDLLIKAIDNPLPPIEVEDAPVKEVSESIDLRKLPILTHYERDAGPYITCGVIIAKDVIEGFQNMSFHRMLVLDHETLVLRVVPRHLYQMIKRANSIGKPLPIAIVIGLHPAILLAAASSPPFKIDELHVANSLLNGSLTVTKCTHNEIFVPANAEMVIEAYIYPSKLADEGPFVDATGTYDIKRKQPIIKAIRLFRRRDAIYQALLPASLEHRLLMGFHREALIKKYVSQVVPEVKDVRLTFGGCGWLHAVISIKKLSEGDGKNAIFAAFAAHPSLKHVIVVDDDVDINNLNDIEWAIATRFQADKDLIVIHNARGSSIDPSANQEKLLTSKMGLDATRPLDKPIEHFIKAKIPNLDKIRDILKEDLHYVFNKTSRIYA